MALGNIVSQRPRMRVDTQSKVIKSAHRVIFFIALGENIRHCSTIEHAPLPYLGSVSSSAGPLAVFSASGSALWRLGLSDPCPMSAPRVRHCDTQASRAPSLRRALVASRRHFPSFTLPCLTLGLGRNVGALGPGAGICYPVSIPHHVLAHRQ